MTEFMPGFGFAGGVLIGVATAALLLLNGKIAGISGIFARTLMREGGAQPWRLAFLVGLPVGAWLVKALVPEARAFQIDERMGILVAGGLLVGIGTQLANGCTSGHGVCGLARGSVRSAAATLIFLSVAAVTTILLRHGFGAPG